MTKTIKVFKSWHKVFKGKEKGNIVDNYLVFTEWFA